MDQNPQPPQKLIDFNRELEELCKKYQYELQAVLDIDRQGRGIYPVLRAIETQPKDEGVALNPAPSEVPEEKKETASLEASGDGGVNISPAPDNGTPVVDNPIDNNNPVVDNAEQS